MLLTHDILSQESTQWIIAFYGYGQDAAVYKDLGKKLSASYNLLVINLPYDAKECSIEKVHFINYIEELCTQYNIQQFIGLSYSIGSRFNLIIAECLPQRLKQLILIAPDGVQISLWNRFATSFMGKYLFRLFVKHNNIYMRLLTITYRVHIIDKSMYAFSKWHMRDEMNRQKVYHVWMNTRKLIPNLSIISNQQKKYGFNIIAFFGKHDKIIYASRHLHLRKKIPTAKIMLLNKNHQMLDNELFDQIRFLLNK